MTKCMDLCILIQYMIQYISFQYVAFIGLFYTEILKLWYNW